MSGCTVMPDRCDGLHRMMKIACLAVGALVLTPFPAAQARVIVLFVPRPPLLAPPPVRAQPPTLLWFMPRAMPSPPVPLRPPPVARCYTGSAICPLEPSAMLGYPCSCPTHGERV